MKYTFIIPVYNRLNEVKELIESAERLDFPRDEFELLFVDDGSTDGFKQFITTYHSKSELRVRFIYQSNQGPGKARNNGMMNGKGKYFIFLDSDCLLPPEYLITANKYLEQNPLDAFGGSDAAHTSFTNIQKAINYAMTSFFTTGGIRGRKRQLSKFQPRSFNMGITNKVFQDVGGFSTIHPGEDPDLSLRIRDKGYSIGLIPDLFVYHKRRINLKIFLKQVYKFGLVRNILFKWHPNSFSLVFFLPALFLLGTILLLLLGIFVSAYFFIPIIFMIVILFADCFSQTKSLNISFIAVIASFFQLYGYGWGFIKSYFYVILLKKDERKVFPKLFFE